MSEAIGKPRGRYRRAPVHGLPPEDLAAIVVEVGRRWDARRPFPADAHAPGSLDRWVSATYAITPDRAALMVDELVESGQIDVRRVRGRDGAPTRKSGWAVTA